MNVRIEDQDLRFKISKAELHSLLEGDPVHTKMALLDKMIVVTLTPKGRGKMMEPKLVLDGEDAYLNLLVSPVMLQKLFDMGQSREGVRQDIDGVSICLQVHMRGACSV